MFGKFQQSYLRIEIEASQSILSDALTKREILKKWLPTNYLLSGMPPRLTSGVSFNIGLGVVSLSHQVEVATDNCLRILLSGAIDGYHEWYWGSGWVQSKLEGVSLLPLSLVQTVSLLSLREFIKTQK